jgi:tetrapyrrole methylase family protein/MazG family protein
MYEKEKEILKNKESFNIEDLKLIVKILRAPGGCPWDAEQTHKSIIPGMIEETYEVVEAIEAESADMLKEELGDVLLQLVFHAEIESENGVFAFDDAVTDVCKKMIVRHPHVFGDVIAKDSATVLNNWDKIKAETKSQKDLGEKLDSIAKPLPALIRTQKVMHKAAKEITVSSPEVSEKLTADEKRIGDMIASAISECEKLDIQAETLLRHYCDAMIEAIKNK